ncbi:MAG: ABC transporter permease [Bacillota bacterium]
MAEKENILNNKYETQGTLKTLISKLKHNENLYYAFTNAKVVFGLSLFSAVCLFALVGPYFTDYGIYEFAGAGAPAEMASPSLENPFGITAQGYDVFTRTVYGLRSTILVGFVGGFIASIIGLIIGLIAGYKGGMVDELLMGLTNVFLTFPQLPILIVIAAYLPYRGITHMAVLVGLVIWPWTARAVRSQALSLKNEEHVNLSRISANSTLRILVEDIAANMFSYIFMVFILQYMGTIMATVGLEFLGLGPTRGVSLGLVMQRAVQGGALYLGYWWWAILPGLFLMLMIFALYFINTGMDEVFNPELREM